MPIVEHAVIAAAGLGSRLGHGIPKCLLEVEGRTLLERQLELLQGVPDVRVVVGYEKERVIEAAIRHRRDVIFRINHAFRSTSTADSYAMGAEGLHGGCLFLDADILFDPSSFAAFVAACGADRPLIAVTEAKTDDAVFAHLDEAGRITAFSRTERSSMEWANLAWLPSDYFRGHSGSAYSRIERDLPVAARQLVSFEVDTEADLARLRSARLPVPGPSGLVSR